MGGLSLWKNLKGVPAAWEGHPKMVGVVVGRNKRGGLLCLRRTKEGLSVDDDFGTKVGMLLIILQRDYALSTQFSPMPISSTVTALCAERAPALCNGYPEYVLITATKGKKLEFPHRASYSFAKEAKISSCHAFVKFRTLPSIKSIPSKQFYC